VQSWIELHFWIKVFAFQILTNYVDTNEFFYDKHVERMENWKDINEEEEWASKVGLATLFLLNWETSMSNIML
jgi:hypothetical protein